MKSSVRYLLLILALLLSSSSILKAETPLRSSEEEAQWAEIRKIKEVYERAAETGKVDELGPYLATNFSLVTVTGEQVVGLEGLRNYTARIWKLIGAGGKYSMKADYQPGILTGDVALGYGSTSEQVITGAQKVYNFASQWTAVLVKQAEGWKLLRVHVSMDPIGNPFVKAFQSRTNEMYGGGGLLFGLLLGWLLTKRSIRRVK